MNFCSSSAGASADSNTVRIRVYDIAPAKLNRFLSNCGAGGIYHSSVTVYGREFTFLGHPFQFSGVFSQAENEAPPSNGQIRGELTTEEPLAAMMSLFNVIVVGRTSLSPEQVNQVVLELGFDGGFRGCDYNLVKNNCNHFSQAFVNRLLNSDRSNSIRRSIGCISLNRPPPPVFPSWINRLARICRRLPFVESVVADKQQRNQFVVETLYVTLYGNALATAKLLGGETFCSWDEIERCVEDGVRAGRIPGCLPFYPIVKSPDDHEKLVQFFNLPPSPLSTASNATLTINLIAMFVESSYTTAWSLFEYIKSANGEINSESRSSASELSLCCSLTEKIVQSTTANKNALSDFDSTTNELVTPQDDSTESKANRPYLTM